MNKETPRHRQCAWAFHFAIITYAAGDISKCPYKNRLTVQIVLNLPHGVG